MSTTLYSHPSYDDLKDDWERYRDLFNGKHTVLTSEKYLHRHALESIAGNTRSADLLKRRIQRTRYLNTIEIIISLWQSFFFRKAPSPDPEVLNLLGDDLYDIDGKKNSLFTFMKDEVLKNFLLYGRVDLLVDAFPVVATSKQEEIAKGLRPFMEVIHPLNRKDWDFEADDPLRIGNYNFFRYQYPRFVPRANSTTEPEFVYRSKVLRRENSKVVADLYQSQAFKGQSYQNIGKEDIGWSFVDSTPIDFKELPISYIESTSWVHDVCEETLRYFNIRSMRDNINHFQGYQKTFIIGEDDREAERALTEYTVGFIAAGGSVEFSPVVDPVGIEKAEQESLQNIFRLGLNQLRHLPMGSKESQSADSMIEEKWNTIALVESTLEQIETLVNDSLKNYARFKGDESFEGRVNLNTDIADRDITKFITIWSSFADKLSKYPEIEKAVLKEMIKELGFDSETTAKGVKAIEDAQLTSIKTEITDPVKDVLNG